MFGAVRPPWIDKEMFYRLPFNFCDRWCERCNLTSICRVYKDIKKTEDKYRKRGKDPNSWKCTFEIIKDSFQKTKRLLEKDAKKWGIDLNSLDSDESFEEDFEFELKELPLYRLAFQYSEKLKNLLEELSYATVEIDDKNMIDNMEIMNYYHLMLPAKIYRACCSKQEEGEDKDDITMDSRTSGFIAVRGLKAIIVALSKLSTYSYLKSVRGKLADLIEVSKDLINLITQEFSLETKN